MTTYNAKTANVLLPCGRTRQVEIRRGRIHWSVPRFLSVRRHKVRSYYLFYQGKCFGSVVDHGGYATWHLDGYNEMVRGKPAHLMFQEGRTEAVPQAFEKIIRAKWGHL